MKRPGEPARFPRLRPQRVLLLVVERRDGRELVVREHDHDAQAISVRLHTLSLPDERAHNSKVRRTLLPPLFVEHLIPVVELWRFVLQNGEAESSHVFFVTSHHGVRGTPLRDDRHRHRQRPRRHQRPSIHRPLLCAFRLFPERCSRHPSRVHAWLGNARLQARGKLWGAAIVAVAVRVTSGDDASLREHSALIKLK